MNLIHNIINKDRHCQIISSSILEKIVTIILLTILAPLYASAETVTFKMQKKDGSTDLINVEQTPSVSDVLVGTGTDLDVQKFFSNVEVKYLSYSRGENAIVFGRETSDGYQRGVMKLTLTPWFKTVTIKKVSIDAVFYDWQSRQNYGVYLFANGHQSDKFISRDNTTSENLIISSSINAPCEEIELIASVIQKTELSMDSRLIVYNLIIEYDTPVAVNPSAGLDGIEVGQLVTLDNCVVEKADGNDYVAHVVKAENGKPVVVNGQSDTYQIPVVWPEDVEEPQTGALVKVTGEIIDNGASKAIQILSTTPLEPIYSHLPPNVLINGAQLENNVIKADDRIEFSHQYGENVKIYYVKRRGEKIDPANAKIDPALINPESTNAEQASNAHYASDNTIDESGTFEYTGPFQLVHKDNLKTTTNNDLVLILQVHSSPYLKGGASWAPSEEFSLRNEMTTELLDILVGKDTNETYHDFLGRPVVHPQNGQLIIRTCSGKSEIIKY